MKVLIACEFSGIIREAFRKRGHDAWSCDLLDTEIPGQHIKSDVLEILDNDWDLMVAHPPCTYLCRNRSRLNKIENQNENIKISKTFFMKLYNANIEKICIENPIPSKMANLPNYNQIIQPYYFGHDYSKKTCLWLKNLPLLQKTKEVELTYIITENGFRYTSGWYKMPRNSKDRSRTFQGIADAMAEQWG
jgi:hypothetical protein